MLTNRNASAAEATGRSLSYQGQPSARQMCLPMTTTMTSAAEDGRRIRQITKQNSFHEDPTVMHTNGLSGPQQLQQGDRRSGRHAAPPPPAGYHRSDSQSRIDRGNKMATPLSRLPLGGGGVGSMMSTSWTSGGGEGPPDADVPPGAAWRQFRNSDRSLRCSAGGQRMTSAKFASSLELSLDSDGAGRGGEPRASITQLGSPTAMGEAAGRGVGRGGAEDLSKAAEVRRYFYQSASPGTQTELARIFESPTRTAAHHARSGESVQNGTHRTLVLNGFPPGLLETSTAGSYPELHNIALHESRRGSLPAPRKLEDETVVRARKESSPYENGSRSSPRQRNEFTIYRSNGNGNHQNGNGKTSTTFHDGNSYPTSSDSKRFWRTGNGTTAPRLDRCADGTPRENIYEEIDGGSLRSSAVESSVQQPSLPLTTMTTTADAVQSGGYRGPVMSLRLTPDQLALASSPLSNRHRLFSSTRSIQQSFDEEFPNPPLYRTRAPPVHSTGSAHPNLESRCHPRPYSRNPDDEVGASRVPDRVARGGGGVQGPGTLGVTSDGYLEPVTLAQPLDVTVARLEALLQEKDGERKRLQAAMEDKECCLIKQLRIEKRNSELRLVELADEWNRRLACQQQKAFHIEQSLLSQVYKLRTEKKTTKEQLDRLRLENESLLSRVGHLENDLKTSTTNEARLQSLNDEQQKEVECLRAQLMDATAALLSSATTNKDLNKESASNLVCSPPAKGQSGECRHIQSANYEEMNREEAQEEDRFRFSRNSAEVKEEVEAVDAREEEAGTSAPIAICRSNAASGSSDDDVIGRLERELEETRSRLMEAEERMQTDQEQWMDEKKKVIAYQKQLQLNYIQMVQRNKTLQQETHQLALELECQHIRQVDAEAMQSAAPLANAEETTCAELAQAARAATLTRST